MLTISIPLVILAIIGFCLNGIQALLQLVQAVVLPTRLKNTTLNSSAFVSIHVPAYNEPPEILIQTIKSLTHLNYRHFEVIIIDNNTLDESVWRPVENYVQTLPENFKFFHVDGLPGFKAGALNYIRPKTNPETKFIATIDADYEVEPDFINKALQYFTDKTIAFVQFPQAYKNTSPRNAGTVAEFEHFFTNYMIAGNKYGSVNNTGTLTVMRASVIEKAGNYNGMSITEDADLGIRMLAQGNLGVYVDEVAGRGLMPYDIEAYKKQKARWGKGNVRVIIDNFMRLKNSRRINTTQIIALLSQLSAWFNFTMLPITTIISSSLMLVLGVDSPPLKHSFWISFLTLLFFHAAKAVSFLITLHGRHSTNNILRAFLIHTGMNFQYSLVPFTAFLTKQLVFDRTNKFILPKMPKFVKNLGLELLFAGVIMAIACLLFYSGYKSEGLALAAASIQFWLILYVYHEVNTTKPVSANLLKKL